MKNIFKCIMIIVGTLIGAGFASGQEIASFFNRFMNNGLWGLILSANFFGIIIFLVMMLVKKFDVSKYENLINNNKLLLTIMKAFSFICFCIMISAIGFFGEQQYGISFWVGAIFAGIVCFISFLFKFSGLEKINNFLVPFILIGILMLGTFRSDSTSFEILGEVEDSFKFMNNWFLSAVLYAGYNSILLIPILVELKAYNLKTKDIILLSVLVTLILAVAGFLIYGVINIYYPEILVVQLPTLLIAKNYSNFVWIYYSIVILFAIFTTAFSCGYSFLKMNSEKNYLRNSALICIFGVLFARIGFSELINLCFPIFGYLGVLQILMIFLLNRRKEK